jgi:hypothetical protein
MQLGDELDLDLRDISERVHRLWSIHAHDMASSVAAVAADGESRQAGEPAAAIAPFHKKMQQQQHTGHRGNDAKGVNTAASAAVSAVSERKASGLCRFTGSLERTPTSVPSPAHARETSAPGADQCRSPWPPCSHRGRVYTEAFSSGHRSGLPHLPFLFPCNSPALVGYRWIAYFLLGRAPVIPGFHWPLF